VGGDFYDFFRLDEHHLALVVADVSGKGVPAAFFMAVSRTLLRAVAQFSQGPADCLRRLNDLLAADNEEMMFVTLFYAVIDTRSGQVVYGNAGHNPPYVVRADGRIEPVPGTGNMALAVMEDLSFDERLLHLHPGDALFMYTDGVTEASDPAQALFGEQRLEAFLSGRHETPVQDLNRELVAAIKVFEAGGAQADDITCLMVRRDGVVSHLPV
jgi:serine phosphatase RsbU (regulator of sigma subunit)